MEALPYRVDGIRYDLSDRLEVRYGSVSRFIYIGNQN
jgi:hypothetical protein